MCLELMSSPNTYQLLENLPWLKKCHHCPRPSIDLRPYLMPSQEPRRWECVLIAPSPMRNSKKF